MKYININSYVMLLFIIIINKFILYFSINIIYYLVIK